MDKLLLEIPTHLETERLYLRCYEPGDDPWYYAMSLKNRAYQQEFESGNAAMSIQRPEDAEILVRKFAVSWISRDCFYLGVFKNLQAQRVSLYCNPKNVRSYRVAERCGFVREGYLRENYQNKNGTVSDTLCYGILKREYESTLKEEDKEKY